MFLHLQSLPVFAHHAIHHNVSGTHARHQWWFNMDIRCSIKKEFGVTAIHRYDW